jgi:prepilin-type N-terminal cleavage/methylation domain-containing protein
MSTNWATRGFSLLELSIVLAVLGVLAVMMFPKGNASAPPGGLKQLEVAFEGLNRFYQENRRLPCPASAGSGGYEDCGGGAASMGTLPWAALGRSPQEAAQFEWTVDYWVNPSLTPPNKAAVELTTANEAAVELTTANETLVRKAREDNKKFLDEAHLRVMEAFDDANAPFLANQNGCAGADKPLRRVAFAIVLRLKSQASSMNKCIVVPDSPQTMKSVSLGELESRGLTGARAIY